MVKYSQKLFYHAKQSATDALKTTSKKKGIQKTAEATGDFIGNKVAKGIAKISQDNSKTITNKDDK